MRSRTVPVLLASASLLALAACSGAGGQSQPAEVAPGFLAQADPAAPSSGALHVSLDYDMAEATGLDPAGAQLSRGWQIPRLVYDTLVDVGPDFAIEPKLAESYEEESPTSYLFRLRDATFSNGRAMTADDVVGSLERLRSGTSLWGAELGPIDRIDVVDPKTVRITLTAAYTPFLAALANTPAAILPMQELAAGTFDPATQMLGTGPFEMKEHRQDEGWTFTRNERYWGAASLGIDEVDIAFVEDEQARLAGLRDGSVEFASFANPDALDLLANVPTARAVNQAQSDFYYLALNSVNPASPFVDESARRAVNAALDRGQIAELALAGQSMPTGVTPAPLPGACDPATLPSTTGDAAALAGASIDLMLYSGDASLAAVAQVVQQQLQAAGATVNLETLDYATYSERMFATRPGDFQMSIGWFAGYADPSVVTTWWDPEAAGFDAGFATPHPELSEAIRTASALPNGEERTAALAEVCRLADEQSEMIPLATRPSVVAYRSDLLSPTILADEGYGDFLRDIAEFRLLKGQG